MACQFMPKRLLRAPKATSTRLLLHLRDTRSQLISETLRLMPLQMQLDVTATSDLRFSTKVYLTLVSAQSTVRGRADGTWIILQILGQSRPANSSIPTFYGSTARATHMVNIATSTRSPGNLATPQTKANTEAQVITLSNHHIPHRMPPTLV
jgi:hypothetical protein